MRDMGKQVIYTVGYMAFQRKQLISINFGVNY